MSEGFFEDFVHSLGFLVSSSANGAFDEVRVKGAPFAVRKLAVQIGSEPAVEFVVNGCHTSSALKREPGEAVCAWTLEHAQEFREARHS